MKLFKSFMTIGALIILTTHSPALVSGSVITDLQGTWQFAGPMHDHVHTLGYLDRDQKDAVILKIKVNNHDWIEYEIPTSMQNNRIQWVDIPVPKEYLRTGGNAIVIDSNVSNPANMVPESLDIIASKRTIRASFSHNLQEWHVSPDRTWNIRLAYTDADTGKPSQLAFDDEGHIATTVVGHYAPNGQHYYERVTLPIYDLDVIKDPKVRVQLHIGSNLQVVRFEEKEQVDHTHVVGYEAEHGRSAHPVAIIHVRDLDQVKVAKLRAHMHIGHQLIKQDGAPGHFLKVKVNDGEWQLVDLLPYMKDPFYSTHWVELPINPDDLRVGANQIVFDATIANRGTMGDGSIDLLAVKTDRATPSTTSSALILDGQRVDEQHVDTMDPYIWKVQLEYNDLPSLTWSDVHVPHVWDPLKKGDVAWYQRAFFVPADAKEDVLWLEFDAVDYMAEVWVNDQFVGAHEGGYTPFKLNINSFNPHIRYGDDNMVTVKVTNQGRTIPMKETPGGFLQDTIGLNYAGIWQGVRLTRTARVYIDNVFVQPDIDQEQARVHVTIRNVHVQSRTVSLRVDVVSADHASLGEMSCNVSLTLSPGEERETSCIVDIPQPILWTIDQPHLYTATVTLAADAARDEGMAGAGERHDDLQGGRDGDRHDDRQWPDSKSVDFGMRKITAQGTKLLFNDESIFLTGQIHWGVYWDEYSPAPSVERVRQEIADLKAAGFNAVKFVLYSPPEYVLDEFDRLGMYAYVEYPIWHPTETEAFLRRTRAQFREMMLHDRNHPSLIMIDFNCEMDRFSPQIDELMKDLYDMGKELAPHRLYLDNSGNGVIKYADFYAAHPYNQLNHFEEVVDMWIKVRHQAGPKPMVFGEYADTDTIRDTEAIKEAHGGVLPWWWSAFHVKDPVQLLARQGLDLGQIKALTQLSVRHAALAKKYYIEATKSHPQMAGLFVTHISDIPTTTPGFYDDNQQLRFSPEYLRQAAAETVLLLGRETQNFWAGTKIAVTPKLSHYNGQRISDGTVRWSLKEEHATRSKTILSQINETGISLESGSVHPLQQIVFDAPMVDKPTKFTLEIQLEVDDQIGDRQSAQQDTHADHQGETFKVVNSWNIWVYPKTFLAAPAKRVEVLDPHRLLDLESTYGWIRPYDVRDASSTPDVLITTEWREPIEQYLKDGGTVIYLGHGHGPIPTRDGSFNAYALAFILEDHDALGDFPHEGFSDLQFLELATRHFMDYQLFNKENRAQSRPMIGRVDLRGYDVASYLSEFEIGEGRLIQSTLRFDGLAYQNADPLTMLWGSLQHKEYENVAGKYLLGQLIRYALQ